MKPAYLDFPLSVDTPTVVIPLSPTEPTANILPSPPMPSQGLGRTTHSGRRVHWMAHLTL